MGNQSKAIGAAVGGTFGAALSAIFVYLIELMVPAPTGGALDIPETIETAIAVVVTAAVSYLITYAFPANKPGARTVQMNPLAVIGAVLMVLLLAGCAGAPQAALEETAADISAGADEESTAAKALADRLLVEVNGPEARGARLSMVIAGISELMADRITQFDPQDADRALGQLTALRAVQERFALAHGIWFETELRLATLTLTNVLVDIGKSRILRDVGLIAGGLNVRGALTRAEVVARQTAIAEAVIRDIRAAFKSGVPPAEIQAAAEARLAYNQVRISAVLGVVSAP